MGNFDSGLFRALAMGPHGKLPDEDRREWTDCQIGLREQSKELLYRIIMLRAAAFLEETGQDDKRVNDEDRITTANICI